MIKHKKTEKYGKGECAVFLPGTLRWLVHTLMHVQCMLNFKVFLLLFVYTAIIYYLNKIR